MFILLKKNNFLEKCKEEVRSDVMSYAIEVRDLTRKYGELVAVDHISFQVEEGELFGFLGPNGAGKTTTIKILTGIIKPTSGSAKIYGYDLLENPLKVKSIIGYTPEYPILYDTLTAREFLDFVAALHNVPRTHRAERVQEMIDLFGLTDEADQQLKSFSKGMKRKVTLAAAFIHRPKLVFLDEPTMGLDAKTARFIKDLLKEFVKLGKTVFMTNHVLEIAEKICEKVAIINRGKIIAIGTLNELRAKEKLYSLEDIFLKLTGSLEEKDLAKYL